MADRTQQPWRQPGWLDQVNAWIQDTLQEKGIRLTGPTEQYHLRPWSTVLRVPTSQGDVYFKAPAPVLVHEAALTQALSQWRPDCILSPLADRGRRSSPPTLPCRWTWCHTVRRSTHSACLTGAWR